VNVAVDERYDGGDFFRASVSTHIFFVLLHVLEKLGLKIPHAEAYLFIPLSPQIVPRLVQQLGSNAAVSVLLAHEKVRQLRGLSVVRTGCQVADDAIVLVKSDEDAPTTTRVALVVQFPQLAVKRALGVEFESIEVDEHGRDHGERRDGERDGPRVHEEVDKEHDESQDEREKNTAENAAIHVEKGLVIAEHQHFHDGVDPLFRSFFSVHFLDRDVRIEFELNRLPLGL